MFITQLKFAIRILKKDGIYSLLNMLGLTLGITVGIILFLYLGNELNYDKHHVNADKVYRVTNHLIAEGADFNTATTARELGEVMQKDLPEIEKYLRLQKWDNTLVTTRNDTENKVQYYEDEIFAVDSTLLDFFTHDVINGDPASCLKGPNKVVLTESIARKYFGDTSPVGQIITFDENDSRTVSAVISDVPDNAHLQYTILLSEIPPRGNFDGNPLRYSEAFWNPGVYTYVMMPEDYDETQFPTRFEIIFQNYFKAFADKINGKVIPRLEPLTDLHFGPEMANDEPVGNINFVYAFTTIGFFLILLACINYTNLATARSVHRAGEIGIRKVLGNSRGSLSRSILLEAIVVAGVAMLLSIIATIIILNATPFNDWIDKELRLDILANPGLIGGIAGITLIVGLLSGIYPALYIPRINVVTALKGSLSRQSGGILLRKLLIVLQFAVSVFVIITTVLMERQIDYMKQLDLGFDQENVVLTGVKSDALADKIDVVKAELMANPDIVSVATSNGVPGVTMGGQVFKVENQDGQFVQKSMFTIYGGADYVNTIGFEILQGRDFNYESETEKYSTYLVNEAGAKEIGWGDSAVNKKVKFFHGTDVGKVIGVVKDFNIESLHEKIEPLFILYGNIDRGTIHVRISGNNISGTIAFIESVITKFDKANPFEYTFLDAEFDKQYKADQIQQQLISTLSYLCIFISILGLIGLSAFSVGQKAKEISIRKTLGGSISHILMLFSREYVKLILIAIVIAIPVADYVIVDWLSAFAYQMPHEWIYYIIPAVIVLLFGFLTVMFQVMRAARANPVDGLRSE
ncbi:MAG: ABC transporter permease [Cyclobacteriaceae bacterium]